MPIPTFNHDNEYVNKYDNKFETKKVNWTGPGFSGMTNPMPYHQIDEQPQPQPFPPMMKKTVNYNGPCETYGPHPMHQCNTIYTQSAYPPTYQPECPLPSHAGWSKDFTKKQCVTPMHLQYGCPPEMINCTYEYPMQKDIKWPVHQQTPQPMHVIQQVPMHVAQPMPMPVAMPMPMPVQQQYPVQWQEQYQQDQPYPVQYNKYYKYPVAQEQPMHYQQQQQQPMERPYGPMGVRHTQTTHSKW